MFNSSRLIFQFESQKSLQLCPTHPYSSRLFKVAVHAVLQLLIRESLAARFNLLMCLCSAVDQLNQNLSFLLIFN